MFKNVHSIAVYAADLGSAVTLYSGLGLEVAWAEEENQSESRVGMHYPQGGPELILHNNAERQFPELTVAVEDLCGLYKRLRRDPGFLWFETPHPTKQGCAAFVRTPDGNVLSLLSPGCSCDERNVQDQEAATKAVQEASFVTSPQTQVSNSRALRPQV